MLRSCFWHSLRVIEQREKNLDFKKHHFIFYLNAKQKKSFSILKFIFMRSSIRLSMNIKEHVRGYGIK